MTNEKRGGFTLPAGSASQALQELLKDEHGSRPDPEESAAPTPPAEEPAPSPPSHEVLKEVSNERTEVPTKERSLITRKVSSRAGPKETWWEGVKARAKAGSSEGRRVRLNVDVDEDVHLRMKIWCVTNGYKFNEMVPALLAAFLEAAEE